MTRAKQSFVAASFARCAASSRARGPANGKDIIVAMSAHLVAVGIPATEREAVRLLAANGFRYGDVLALADDALFAARQSAVAAEMAAPEQAARSGAVANGATSRNGGHHG
jgi:hypothetical protein